MDKHDNEDILSCGCGHCSSSRVNIEEDGFIKRYFQEIIKLTFGGVLIVISFLLSSDIIKLVTLIAAALINGFDLLFSYVKNLKLKHIFNESVLMIVASITAFLIGESFEGAFILFLYNLGELLEKAAGDNAKKRISSLSKIRSERVRLIGADGIKEVDPTEVSIGSLIEIRMGESVAIDGVLIGAPASFDAKSITGESNPVCVNGGGFVISGYVNIGNSIIVKTTSLYSESMVEKIVSTVNQATKNKAKSQKFISKFAKYYTPVVFAISLMIAIIPTMVFGRDANFWIRKTLNFLVISCPCALVISVPLAYFVGIGALAKKGVLVKGSNYIDSVSNVKTIVFDKTGTLTEGELTVSDIYVCDDVNRDEIYSLICSLEEKSTHPVARAIRSYLIESKILKCTAIEEVIGKGIKGVINDNVICIGNREYVLELGAELPTELNDYGNFIILNGRFVGAIKLVDKVKDNAKTEIELLKRNGITKTVMLSGDNKSIVDEVGYTIGIDEVYSQLLPIEKCQKVKRIKEKTQGLIMYVGDGVNDLPSLASSDVGVAIGSKASDIAIDCANVVLLNGNLSGLNYLINKSKKVKRSVFQNIIGSISVKILIMIVSLIVNVPVYIAMLSDVGIMLLAVLNSLKNAK